MMNNSKPYRSRIISSSIEKKSPIILALDLDTFDDSLFLKCKHLISLLESHICAIKMNFHLFLSLSNDQILNLNNMAHQYNLQSIADIKLNDIGNTNKVTIDRLYHLGFDAVIVNPFIGPAETKSLVDYAHSMNLGIISLVYMSQPTSFNSYGLQVLNDKESENISSIPMYKLLYSYSRTSNIDGIIIGATKINIIKEISNCNDSIPIYTPGLITQGGSVSDAFNAGTDYFIVGRHIINSISPLQNTTDILKVIRSNKYFNIT